MTPFPIEIDPPNKELTFTLSSEEAPAAATSRCVVTLGHPGTTTATVAFKVKISHRCRYTVRPVQGTLRPHESQQIVIQLVEDQKKTLVAFYELFKYLESDPSIGGGAGAGAGDDITDVLLVQTCIVDALDGDATRSPRMEDEGTSKKESLKTLWKSVAENGGEDAASPLLSTEKIRIRHVLDKNRPTTTTSTTTTTGTTSHGTPKRSRATATRRRAQQQPHQQQQHQQQQQPVGNGANKDASNAMSPERLVHELSTLSRKYNALVRLVASGNRDEFLCGCCQTTTFSSNPTSLDRAPVSSRVCGHTICRSCVENCHVAQVERLNQFDNGWIKCPLCNAVRAFSVCCPIVNRSLCTAIAAAHALQTKALEHASAS